MVSAKPTKTPISKQDTNNHTKNKTQFPYQEAVGSLLYLSCKTRPDICYAVNYASRHCKNQKQQDIMNVKRTMRYLKGSKEDGLMYSNKGEKYTLQVYCDSDHAGDNIDRMSTTGFMIFYGNAPIAWVSRKQTCVALHSTEAEYIAAAQCYQQTRYIKSVLQEMLSVKIHVNMSIDNTSLLR